MTDIGAGGFGGEADITSRIGIQSAGRQNFFQRAIFGKQGLTANVQASLKFDIPGLKDFRTQIEGIKKALDSLDSSFRKMADSPEKWAKNLKAVNVELATLRKGGVGSSNQAPGAPIQVADTPRVPAGQDAGGGMGSWLGGLGQKMSTSGSPGIARMGTGMQAAAGGAGAASGGAAAVGAAIAALTSMATSMFARFDRGMQVAGQADVYTSRMAPMMGVGGARGVYGAMTAGGAQGMPGIGGMVDVSQALYQGTQIGAVWGGQGVGGQRGAAYAGGLEQLQRVMPGLTPQQAGSMQVANVSNIQGMKFAAMRLGVQALPVGPGGKLKGPLEYWEDLLRSLQKMERVGGGVGEYTKEELIAMQYPGSQFRAWLSAIGMDEVQQGAFFEWAINRARWGEMSGNIKSYKATEAQQRRLGGGQTPLATSAQELAEVEGLRDAKFTEKQYEAMNKRMDNEARVIELLTSVDSWLERIYSITGQVPGGAGNKGGLIKMGLGGLAVLAGGIMTATGVGGAAGVPLMAVGGASFAQGLSEAASGDPEFGLSHLSPDLRGRVGRMMQANPNLRVSSAYRDSLQQGRLQGKGPFAPAGKSQHGRGNAIDIGPRSQMGWLNKFASKFGLDTAARLGEPWHVQLAGSMGGLRGDPPVSLSDRLSQRTHARSDFWASEFLRQATAAKFAGASASGTTDMGTLPGASATGGGGTSADVTPNAEGQLSMAQMVQIAYDAGFRGENLVNMVAIAGRESHWSPSAHRSNKDKSLGSGDRGLWQINYIHDDNLKAAGIISSWKDLFDPLANAKAAFQLSNGGTNLGPWTAGEGGWTSGGNPFYGVEPEWKEQARAAAKQAGLIGDAGYYNNGGGGGSMGMGGGGGSLKMLSAPVTFNNTFSLTFGGNPTRAEIDVAAKQIASRLEVQMHRAVSRRN